MSDNTFQIFDTFPSCINDSGIYEASLCERNEIQRNEQPECMESAQYSDLDTDITSCDCSKSLDEEKRNESCSEVKALLLDVAKTQNVILKEIQTLKDDVTQLTREHASSRSERKSWVASELKTLQTRIAEDSAKHEASVADSLDEQKKQHKVYVGEELRKLEYKMNGLSAVLDHVQKRCLEREIKDEATEHESVSSESAEEEEVRSEVLEKKDPNPELVQEQKNRCWLRENHLKLLDAINPRHDWLLHHLTAENILTLSDEEKILSHSTRKEQSRELLLRLRRCTSGQFKTFLRHLDSEHPVETRFSSVDCDTGEADEFPCAICDVITLAQVDDVIDYVYQQGFLDATTLESVMKMSSARERWCCLLGTLADKTGGNDVLVKALSKKYPAISQRLALSKQTSFECCCA